MNIFLQAAEGGGSNVMSIVMIVGMVVVMYFFMIRPQQKKQKEQKAFRDTLKKGDEVTTIGGIYGKIYQIDGTKVIVEVDKGTKLTLDLTSISGAADAAIKK